MNNRNKPMGSIAVDSRVILMHETTEFEAGAVLADVKLFAPATKDLYQRNKTFSELAGEYSAEEIKNLFIDAISITPFLRFAFTGETAAGADDNTWEGAFWQQFYACSTINFTIDKKEIIRLPIGEVMGVRVINTGANYETIIAQRTSEYYKLPKPLPIPTGGKVEVSYSFPDGLTLKAAADGADQLFGTADKYGIRTAFQIDDRNVAE